MCKKKGGKVTVARIRTAVKIQVSSRQQKVNSLLSCSVEVINSFGKGTVSTVDFVDVIFPLI